MLATILVYSHFFISVSSFSNINRMKKPGKMLIRICFMVMPPRSFYKFMLIVILNIMVFFPY